MQTGHTLILAIIPVILEGCCVEKHPGEKTGLQKPREVYHYRAVQGEAFMMRCANASSTQEAVWSRYTDEADEDRSLPVGAKQRARGGLSGSNVLNFPALEVRHSGNYSCLTGGRELIFHLQVLERKRPGLPEPQESRVTLTFPIGGKIPCPTFQYWDRALGTGITWYKGGKAISELPHRDLCQESGHLVLCQVYLVDAGDYFCDTHTNEQGVLWANRRAVKAEVIPSDSKAFPIIVRPCGNETEEVEIGQPHNLTCEVNFRFERTSSALVQWYSSSAQNEDMVLMQAESQKQKLLDIPTEFRITHTAVIQEVSLQHLQRTYTCVASNSLGNRSASIKLQRKTTVKQLAIFLYPIALVVLVTGMGITVHMKWLEIFVYYKSHWPKANHDEEKEFDAFLSYVWSPPSEECVEGSTGFSPSGPGADETASLSDPAVEEGSATQRQPEVLLPRVLEGRWGYRLCLQERDLLPGGAYTDEVVHVLKRSRMLICLLSVDYLCNSDAVFVLESGIQVLLQDSHLKVLLIWTTGKPASLGQLNPPLPLLVQRTLRALPSLNWPSDRSTKATSDFWGTLRKAMAVQKLDISSVFPGS